MNNKIITLILIGLLVTACNKEKSIQLNAESLTEGDLKICNNAKCPEVTINYLKASGNGNVAEKINEKITSFIISSLSMAEDEKEKAKTIEEAATTFIESFNADRARFPDMAADYFAEISVNEIYNSPKHICLELRQYLYTGGAHGYGTTSFLNIDPDSGEELTANELFKNKKGFTVFAEKKFREQQKIAQDESINDPGFWFENDSFHLPNTVGFTQDSLIFVYNQYDIASYAEGPIELKISLKEAKPYLKIIED
ncbi:DUF3298/DUF4163 domain-containing protein [Aequorivita sp. H23M31]|uniref:DUF3298/DUF4163 domain-containing protein n=1 Tax=Aequorivita ciconiae TaxID=2494375 RepID=A0A410G5C5_9FLAO|nr:DUF3298 and DUF4163 domain-containing protein [Aequorivita sp. H23M31]QAA82459.1 DUF3298/DUF4163 domain-containing protein [Aequorivita sp. H23M31]